MTYARRKVIDYNWDKYLDRQYLESLPTGNPDTVVFTKDDHGSFEPIVFFKKDIKK